MCACVCVDLKKHDLRFQSFLLRFYMLVRKHVNIDLYHKPKHDETDAHHNLHLQFVCGCRCDLVSKN